MARLSGIFSNLFLDSPALVILPVGGINKSFSGVAPLRRRRGRGGGAVRPCGGVSPAILGEPDAANIEGRGCDENIRDLKPYTLNLNHCYQCNNYVRNRRLKVLCDASSECFKLKARCSSPASKLRIATVTSAPRFARVVCRRVPSRRPAPRRRSRTQPRSDLAFTIRSAGSNINKFFHSRGVRLKFTVRGPTGYKDMRALRERILLHKYVDAARPPRRGL
ncbi:hypothetical protein EVAR_84027_1 [Eumeta japonica]|uniref:Uncharacterized protein n=1 Tax=Eumeta variegata TaxID=151549 RepID=A0A4C1X7H0_EUMVA|nr:hypothetical protein EVAR_84027_1 [Eumeta japonica]